MIEEWERNTISLKKKLHSEREKTGFIYKVNVDAAGLG